MSSKKYRVGIIGRTGKGNYGHGLDRVWEEIPQAEVIAVADEHKGGREAAAKITHAKAAYADYREMLDKETLDLVAVAPRWIDQHRDMLLACIEHGCHIYMEKPFVQNLEQADEVVRAIEAKHLKLAIAHTNRYSPTRAVAQKVIEEGEIGDVLEYRARGKEDSRRGGGEDLWVLGTHMLDMMRIFAGDVAACFATATSQGRPITKADVSPGNEGIGPLAADGLDALYSFRNTTATGYFASHRAAAGSPSRFGLTVFGSKGVIQLHSGYLRPAFILKDSSWSPGQTNSKWTPITSAGIGKPETQKQTGLHGGNVAAVKDLINAIEQDRQPQSNVYDARAATEMIAAVFESHRLRGPAAFPLKNRKNPLTMLEERT